MKKKFLILAFLLLVLVPFNNTVNAESEKEVKVVVNERYINMEIKPFIYEGRTMAPIRYVDEALDGEYLISSSTHPLRGIWIWRFPEDYGLTMFPGYPISLVGDKTYRSDIPAMTINSITYVPIRFVADYLNYDVQWDQETFTVKLSDKEEVKDDWARMEKYFDEVACEKLNNSKDHDLSDFREAIK